MNRLDPGTVVRLVVLAVLGILSLPLVALLFDDQGSENWIFPVQLLFMAAVGALVWPRRLVGAAIGVGFALLGVVVFFLMISGFEGA